jgi:uncharacterized membrane protein (UPF0182 family)
MYLTILALVLILGGWLAWKGFLAQNRTRAAVGLLVAGAGVFFFWFMGFWGEMLWFDALGYNERFWEAFLFRTGLAVAGGVVGWAAVFFLTLSASAARERGWIRRWPPLLGAFIGVSWGYASWESVLMFLNRVSTQVQDPILGHDVGFYLFTLPVLEGIQGLVLTWGGIALASSGAIFLVMAGGTLVWDLGSREQERPRSGFGSLRASAIVVLLALGAGMWLERYNLMYSTLGAVRGAGWTDVNIKLPAYMVMTWACVLAAAVLLVPPAHGWVRRILRRKGLGPEQARIGVMAGLAGILALVWFVGLMLIPGLSQWLRVEPNEITFERPYIEHNIAYTRKAFGLDRVEVREFPAREEFTRQMVADNENLFDNIRLWDWRALDAVYKQFQEIRLYYEFRDVDIDRYRYDDTYREVMVSARELEPANLPRQSQTFVNLRFKYTHGYGITLTTVSDFTPQGLPNLLIKDIPPVSAHPELEVRRPEIYYGELTDAHVYVNTTEQEFDFPAGEENRYISYPGTGGVELSNAWRRFLYGWKFDGTRFFLSGYPTDQSRVMFHRDVRTRVQTLAPFLRFDDDPYVVLADGRLYWIVDAYTASGNYPYSEPFQGRETIEYPEGTRERTLFQQSSLSLDGVNYVRNSVKAVVDAFNGSVDFYVFEPEDPLIRVWDRIFPDLFKPREQMPAGLQAHVRYPADMLLVQGLVYAKYHMTDPEVFYNQEDLWIRATEKYYQNVQPVEPYYIMWEQPQAEEAEFSLILPFTPKNRQVLIGWMAGLCDGDNYGRLLTYKFPKEKRVLGPQQVETKIDQDPFLSQQLTLWDQRGSQVVRGNVLAIPIDNSLIYVEPIYLQAETAAYPELRLVVMMHGDELSYAETFDQALENLLSEHKPGPEAISARTATGQATSAQLIDRASRAFDDYLGALGDRNFQQAAEALDRLQQALQQLQSQ